MSTPALIIVNAPVTLPPPLVVSAPVTLPALVVNAPVTLGYPGAKGDAGDDASVPQWVSGIGSLQVDEVGEKLVIVIGTATYTALLNKQ